MKSFLRIAAVLGGISAGCAIAADPPVIDLYDARTNTLESFTVRAYVVAVIDCPPGAICVGLDGLVLAKAPDPSPDETVELWAGDDPSKLNLVVGREYLLTFKVRVGVIGVTPTSEDP